MKTFIDIWQLLSPKAEYVNNIFDLISDKLSKGKFVDYNPLFAIKKKKKIRFFAKIFASGGTLKLLSY